MNNAAGRHLREWIVLSVALLACLLLAQRANWFERADNWLYDASVAWSGRSAAPDILILAIDEASLARVGRWPWSRHRLAEVIGQLAAAGSGPVLVDVILAEPQMGDPSADVRLAAAFEAHGRVVLPVFMPQPLAPAVLPLAPFAAVTRLGHAQALVDSDGVTRRFLPRERDDSTPYDHLSLVLLDRAGMPSATPPAMREAAPPRLVPFAGPAGHFTRISVADILDGRVAPDRLRGRIVLIGATATGLGDTVVTPLAGINGAMPGVEFVANVLDAERAGLTRRVVSLHWQMATTALVLLAFMVLLLLLSPRLALLVALALALAAMVTALALLLLVNWWWPPVAVMAVIALAYPLWSWRRLEASLATMTRETTRIAGMLHPGARAQADQPEGPHFLDPVENRIAAITHAVDEVADALAVVGDTSRSAQYRDDMMRHLAHDLRSPLVSLRALAGQLRVGSAADHAAMIARVDACARRSLELTEQFLLLGRAQSVDSAQFGEVDLVQVLHSCADDLWEDAQREGVRIERQCALDLALVAGDERLLRRALLNLGWNALRYGPAGGVVTLSLQDLGDAYRIGVHDQGAGFAEQELGPLSQRYARGASSAQGHGLGLALVQLVAQKHQATIDIAHPATGGFTIGLRMKQLAVDAAT